MKSNTARVLEPIAMGRKIPLSEPLLDGNEWRYVKDCLDSGYISSVGKYVSLFEEAVAEYSGVKGAVATINGTSAIHTALLVSGVGPGDKVIVPALTFIASVNPIRYCGAEPVFVDSKPHSWNLDPRAIEDSISRLTGEGSVPKAIIVVHLYGRPAAMDEIMEIARKHNLVVIEDATEALGSLYKSRMAGSIGDIGCYSFNGNKLTTTGGGGMLVSDNVQVLARARYLINQAKDVDNGYHHGSVGYNYRLSNIQAAIGLAQLERIDLFISRKREIARYYDTIFEDNSIIEPYHEDKDIFCNYWLYSITLNTKNSSKRPEEVIEGLQAKGIEARPIFKPVHLQPPYVDISSTPLPHAESIYARGLCLPSSLTMTSMQHEKVCQELIGALRQPTRGCPTVFSTS